MAIELESSGMSPRISFSHDFCQSDQIVPVEQQQHPRRSNSTGIEFDFCVRKSFDQDSSSADELFSDGKILPTEVKKKKNNNNNNNNNNRNNTPQASPLPLLPPGPALSEENKNNQESLKGGGGSSNNKAVMMRDESGDDLEDNKQTSNKSFWKVKRSSSLNCGSGYGRSLCPLPLLSRSNSTGSAQKDNHNHHHHKENPHKSASIRSSSHSSSSSSSFSSNHPKPPLKKNYGAYGNGIHVNPVLNVPSANLFGLGSIFFNGKDHKNKKKSCS